MDSQTFLKKYFELDKIISEQTNKSIVLLKHMGLKQMARCLEISEEQNTKENIEFIAELEKIMRNVRVICIVYDSFDGIIYFYVISDSEIYDSVEHGASFSYDDLPSKIDLAMEGLEKLSKFPVDVVQSTSEVKVISLVLF